MRLNKATLPGRGNIQVHRVSDGADCVQIFSEGKKLRETRKDFKELVL